jgi:hypothetical protein
MKLLYVFKERAPISRNSPCPRLVDEEKFLVGNLPGYAEYQHKVRFRLIPLLW